jgi:uncharacterized membrane protein
MGGILWRKHPDFLKIRVYPEETKGEFFMNDINDQDKLMAALAWVLPIPVAIIILVVEDMKTRPFQKYHAINSLIFGVVFTVLFTIISTVTCGFGLVLGFAGLVVFYWAYQAYQGEWVEIPFLTDFAKKQGWI